jgi:hypothetical protein
LLGIFDPLSGVRDYPRQMVSRDNLIELYRGYGYRLLQEPSTHA